MSENTSRLYIRLPEETKQRCFLRAKQKNVSNSEYIRNLIDNDGKGILSTSTPTHEELTASYLFVNKMENLMASSPDLPADFKRKLEQEIRNYGRY